MFCRAHAGSVPHPYYDRRMVDMPPSHVSLRLRRSLEIRFVREGRALCKLHMRNEKVTSDEGLVGLEHVLATLGRDETARRQAIKLDPEGAAQLGAAEATEIRNLT